MLSLQGRGFVFFLVSRCPDYCCPLFVLGLSGRTDKKKRSHSQSASQQLLGAASGICWVHVASSTRQGQIGVEVWQRTSSYITYTVKHLLQGRSLHLNNEDAVYSIHKCAFEDPPVCLVGLWTEKKKGSSFSWSPVGMIKPSETEGHFTGTDEALTVGALTQHLSWEISISPFLVSIRGAVVQSSCLSKVGCGERKEMESGQSSTAFRLKFAEAFWYWRHVTSKLFTRNAGHCLSRDQYLLTWLWLWTLGSETQRNPIQIQFVLWLISVATTSLGRHKAQYSSRCRHRTQEPFPL